MTNNYFGPWIVVAMAFDSQGHPVQGLHVDFTEVPDASIPMTNQNSVTNTLGVANVTLVPNQNLVTNFNVRASIRGSVLSGETIVPLGASISASPSSLAPGASSGSSVPSLITESVVQLNGQGNPVYTDLTTACSYPFTSHTLATNCSSGTSQSSSNQANVFCNDFKIAENIVGVISCVGFAAIVIGAFTGVIGGAASCPLTAGGGCAVAFLSADALFAVGDILEGTCLDYLLGAYAEGTLHSSLPSINVSPKAASFIVSFVQSAVDVVCNLATAQTVSVSGGQVSTTDGVAQVVIPSHTISSGTISIVITEITPQQASTPLPGSNPLVGSLVNVQFYNGALPSGPITLTLSYNSSAVQAGQVASIFQDGSWTKLPTSLGNAKANSNITSPGDYAVLSSPTTVTPASPRPNLPFVWILSAVGLIMLIIVTTVITFWRRKARTKRLDRATTYPTG
jgi:hypothetical protein